MWLEGVDPPRIQAATPNVTALMFVNLQPKKEGGDDFGLWPLQGGLSTPRALKVKLVALCGPQHKIEIMQYRSAYFVFKLLFFGKYVLFVRIEMPFRVFGVFWVMY